MQAYIYQAALLCWDCAWDTKAELDDRNVIDTGDSGDYPQGPYPNGGGEADSPAHCDMCGTFLGNDLTDEGRAYVVAHPNKEWDVYYGIDRGRLARLAKNPVKQYYDELQQEYRADMSKPEPLPAFAWPGGYTMKYVTDGGDVLCADCATEAILDIDCDDPPTAYDAYYEGPTLYCDGCNHRLVASYGDPDASDEENDAESDMLCDCQRCKARRAESEE